MSDEITVIGPSIHIAGTVTGEADLKVLGRVDGTITIGGTLTVAAGGIVKADVEAAGAVIDGALVGDVRAQEAVLIGEEGRVVGDITAARLGLREGGALRGRVDLGDVGDLAPPAEEEPAAPAEAPPAARRAAAARKPAAKKAAAKKAAPRPPTAAGKRTRARRKK